MLFPSPSVDATVVRYRIFFVSSASPQETDGDSLESSDYAFVESRRAAYLAFAKRETASFVWHKHRFHLDATRVSTGSSATAKETRVRTWCLHGETAVGDALQDEWVVTWLLWRLSTEFAADELIVHVNDSDGEFLLIECADVLPEWVTPENSAHRIFIRRGALHLVPQTLLSDAEGAQQQRRRRQQGAGDNQFLISALLLVHAQPTATRANNAMQRILAHKNEEIPEYLEETRHRARCIIPRRTASVIKARPDVVGAAVEAFFYREPKEAAKIWRRMAHIVPDTLTEFLVTFSRCQYAQLRQPQGQQQFTPPKAFQDALPSDTLLQEMVDAPPRHQQHRDALARDLGIKLACGLELLYSLETSDQWGVSWRSIIDTVAESDHDLPPAHDENEDDDAWLFVHPDSLEDKLQRMAIGLKEHADVSQLENGAAGAEELDGIAQMFNNFVSTMSGVDGVEASESVQFDMQSFLSILERNGVEGTAPKDRDGLFDDDDDDEDDSEDEEEDDVELDGDEERLMREAMEEMDEELRDTTLQKTFTRLPVEDTDPSNTDKPERLSDLNDEPQPLNLDFNLLSNLLESLASQEGMAGPVSNLLGELSASKS
ncbi:hypothetical protein PINS_up010938 [Pythium insidiosum]|nr:hypothetical protein PINS_up010938 [Pythium insidiosum]